MEEFDTKPEQPFDIKQGDSNEVALYNRIAAINRINHLVQEKIPGFNLYKKDKQYFLNIDMYLWEHHYKTKARDTQISEDFCQWAAEACILFEKEDVAPVPPEDIKEAYEKAKVSMRDSRQYPSWVQRFFRKLPFRKKDGSHISS